VKRANADIQKRKANVWNDLLYRHAYTDSLGKTSRNFRHSNNKTHNLVIIAKVLPLGKIGLMAASRFAKLGQCRSLAIVGGKGVRRKNQQSPIWAY
jgi:hypothetical protein